MLIHTKYRPDIDGLRAVAILAVVAYHAFPNKFLAGYIGVDIFFVISGFLISSIIFSSLEQGKFSLIEFYERRIKRIFPALIVVMTTSYIFGWLILFSDEFSQLGKHIAGGATFLSNFVLWSETGYFDTASEAKPLLHLWSLGIEEQFYIFWPILLWATYKRHIGFLLVTASILFGSFFFNLAEVLQHHDEAAFYSPLTRFWELMVGGVLAYFNTHKPHLINRRANANAIAGLLLIVSGLIMLRGHHAYPGYRALLPVLGAFLIISAGPKAWINRKILANRLLVSVGLISYPLYLWHWMILSSIHIIKVDTLETQARLACVALSFFLALLTFWFVERPVRQRKIQTIFSVNITVALLTLMILLGATGFFTYQAGGFHSRNANFHAHHFEPTPLADDPKLQATSCQEMFGTAPIANVNCISNTKQPEFMIIGDSHADSFYLAAGKQGASLPALKITKRRMLPFVDYVSHGKRDSVDYYGTSILAVDQALHMAAQYPSIKTIILVTRGSLYFSDNNLIYKASSDEQLLHPADERAFVDGYTDIINRFRKIGKRVVLVTEWPWHAHPPHFLIRRAFDLTSSKHEVLSRLSVEKSQQTYLRLIGDIKRQNSGLLAYDTLPVFCDALNCFAKDEKTIFYLDGDHLNENGSFRLLIDFQSWLKNSKV